MAAHDETAAPAMALGWTILHVPDVPRAVGFYERTFGLERRFVDPAGEYAELATGPTTLAFAAHALIARLTGEPAAEGAPRGLDLALTASPDRIEAAWARALDAGAVPVRPLAAMPWGQTVGFVRDPDGFLVELCTPAPTTA
jgi:catechol 2,3-dioxygenase-like lactoylglutathione lyase family enzyme